jgi:hypothetical protein
MLVTYFPCASDAEALSLRRSAPPRDQLMTKQAAWSPATSWTTLDYNLAEEQQRHVVT